MFLNLDKEFTPYGSGDEIEFDYFTFSGGEPHIRIKSNLDKVTHVYISHRIKSFNDLGILLLATNALKNLGVKKINLFLPYFPAARQDRLMVKGEALSVKVYSELINSQNFSSVGILDPHSEVTPALLNNCHVIENHKFIKTVTEQLPKDLLLVSPDGGALKKIYKLASYLEDYQVIECSKTRNVKTGELTAFNIYSEDLCNKDCLIVDDICDGGGTFLGLAKKLKEKNAGQLYLAISHGIFSKGFDQLKQHFEIIFCTDSFQSIENKPYLKQIKLKLEK